MERREDGPPPGAVTEGEGQVSEAFEQAAGPLRPRLLAHCYRMLGSLQDAEDQVQETYLRAWKAYHDFERRSSVETWLTTIATRSCLNALRTRERRIRPVELSSEAADPLAELESSPELPWLEPFPDARLGTGAPDASALARESLRLAFVSALQHLTPGQRAAVLLRDVLEFSAAEAARTLETTEASANSSLQRGRERLRELGAREETHSPRLPERERDLLGRYVDAFEAYDTDAVVALLREDATWEMPPFLGWYAGRETIGKLIRTRCPAQAPRDLLFVPTSANGQPAAGAYLRDEHGVHRPFQLHVLDLAPGEERIRHVSSFFDVALFAAFELPPILDGARTTAPC